MALKARTFVLQTQTECEGSCIRRITINSEVLKATKVVTGDLLSLTSAESPGGFAVGQAWPSQTISPSHIQVSVSLALTAQCSTGQNVRVDGMWNTRSGGTRLQPDVLETSKVFYVPTRSAGDGAHLGPKRSHASSDSGRRRDWLDAYVRETIVDVRYITPSQIIDVMFQGTVQRFRVQWSDSKVEGEGIADELERGLKDLHLNARTESSAISLNDVRLVTWNTEVVVQTTAESSSSQQISREIAVDAAIASSDIQPQDMPQQPENPYTNVGGLDKQISEIRDLVELPLRRPDLFIRFGLKPPRGLLLHGPPGTGKTHLARAIAAATKASLVVVNGPELSSAYHGETEAKLREVFDNALRTSPCIIVIDELDALCPKREDSTAEVEKRVVATMLTLLDGMEVSSNTGTRVIVIGTTNRPNAIDPALRRPGRFDREIEIGIPDAIARLAIIRILLARVPHSLDESALASIASRSHGYVGADLAALVRDAGTQAIHRWLRSEAVGADPVQQQCDTQITLADIVHAMSNIRPSAMREVFVETPQVRWSDIGGQAHVKDKLKECIEWPLLHPDAFVRLGISPPKGVLLYGPPGCSKTLTAKALATESGINFLAVKGPELVNKYVGESERAIRELFRKARAAAPSIIFFDELDALGSSRTSSEQQGTAHEGMLTTLLNEMDGIQELVNVTVVAATNRPEIIDSALMRPGRLDRILYVGPPDLCGRLEILKIRTSKMAVEESLDLDELAVVTEGCSGAEIVGLCQDAALAAMKEDINAIYVSRKHFSAAAREVRKQITPDMIRGFEAWRDSSGLRSA